MELGDLLTMTIATRRTTRWLQGTPIVVREWAVPVRNGAGPQGTALATGKRE
ncbi:MAG: hypothetical protein U0075_10845 [Thermomicrobiales bacterium]